MRILCIGISHKTADVALREKLAFDAGQVRCALAELAGRWKQAEFVVLSTCNRTELYTARPIHGHPREEELRHWLGEFRGIGPAEYDAALYTLTDANAVRQLFAVAAGLDSLVVGEAQIASQLKEAYAQALQASAARTVMNKLFQRAFRAAKEIRSETQLADGKVSIASVAIDFVARAFETLKAKRVLNVGAGKMNELMLKHLAGLGVGQILVANRSPQRAAELAAAVGAKAVAMEELAERLGQVDIVLTSTASPEPIITRKMIETAQRRRKCQPLLIVDIAVPRDVEAGVGEL
ncbi:MAG: glutamyl-tRNA reductase, partial [Phycisphaerae bacterium]|nr:glutamyl-tRNA reductase [Phycisphaerae bacterium]